MNVLITGGAGFVGSHLTERLLADGHSVVVLDDLSTGRLPNLAAVFHDRHFLFHQGSVLDAALVGRLAEDCNLIIHLAAAVGVRQILLDPLSAMHTNIDGTETVLEAAAKWQRRVLVASTSEVYGKNEAESLCEDADSIVGPSSISRWSYATAKKLDEFLALAYAAKYGIRAVITRFFNIVGPRQRSRYGMVLPNFIRAALGGKPIRVFGDGRQTRNFTFIEDCIEAIVRLMSTPAADGQPINIGGTEEIAIEDLAKRVRRVTGSSSPIVKVPYAEAYGAGGFEDMRRRVPCLCRIQGLVGWSPVTPLDQIIRRSVQYLEQHMPSAA
jgi:UDP-glucose 4-epimerase